MSQFPKSSSRDIVTTERAIRMNFISGCTLGTIWDRLDVRDKERLCHDIWCMISQWRQIVRPPHLAHLYQCLADGSPATPDPLLKDLDEPPRPLYTDEAVRAWIHQRYLHYFGQHFADILPVCFPGQRLPSSPTMTLPRAIPWSIRVAILSASLTGS